MHVKMQTVGAHGRGMLSLATRQTQLYMVMPPRAGVLSSIWGVWRVAKLTIPPTIPLAIPPTVRPTILLAISPPIPLSSPGNPATHQLAN